jgi:hypothetical protein
VSDYALGPAGGGAEEALPPISRRLEVLLWTFVGLSVAAVLFTGYTRHQATVTLGGLTCLFVLIAWRRALLAWPTLVGVIFAVILFVPIRRYTLGGGLPFSLEPYRLLIALVVPLWLAAALVDGKTRVRATGLEAPVLMFAIGVFLSLATNPGRVAGLAEQVVKLNTFFASFFAVMYLVASVIDSREMLDRLIKVLVVGGGIVAILTLVEWQTGQNYFNDLERVFPLLDFHPDVIPTTGLRGDKPRAYGSAQHAIALGAALVILLPLAVYLWKRTGKFAWMGLGGLMVMGALGTGSRTAVVMLVVSLVMFFRYKREATIKLLPYLLPMFMVVQVAMPGTLGTFKGAFFPKGGVIADEEAGEGSGTGRLKDVGPSLREWGQKPLFGEGFGTRLTSESDGMQNAIILDDQWLSSLLELGICGVAALVWMIVRALRRLKFRARRSDDDYSWLLTSLATGIAAYAIGMVTYDAFSFIQVTLLLFIFLGLGATALRLDPDPEVVFVPEPWLQPQPQPVPAGARA